MNVHECLQRLEAVKPAGEGKWIARCPAHDDRTRSLSVAEGEKGVLLYCQAGCETGDILAAIGVEFKELFNDNGKARPGEIEATYDYVDETGHLLYQVVRYAPKAFRQRQPDGGGGWIWSTKGVRRVLYRLPEIIEAVPLDKLIHIVEGEKDVYAVEEAGGTATCSPGGAGNWRPEYAQPLRHAHVRIVADRDDAGRQHAGDVEQSLVGVVQSVEVVQACEGRDAADHLAAGFTLDDFEPLTETEPGRRDLTHDGLALELGDQWRDNTRYVDAWNQWFFWNEAAWRPDERLEHMTRCRGFLRERASRVESQDPKEAKKLRQADTVAKVVGLARSNAAQASGVDQWDADPWLMGTPGGTLDLRTGQVRKARPHQYITKLTAVAPAPSGTGAPLWAAHMDRVTAGDTDLQAYLQRFFGYALTGSIREHVFPFGHGGGANGKGVTLNAVKRIFGGYAASIPTEMLMVSPTDRHPTEVARLRGVRFAIGSEVEAGKRWAEAKIKALTGGDPIAARFMRQDFFEFQPQFKLFVIGNHLPSLWGVDEAMARRLHLVPFTVTIPEEERDHDLPEKLRDEWPAILRWMINGCLAWQGEGLNPPEVVRRATQQYLECQDAIALWLEECCEVDDPTNWTSSGSLFGSWKEWAENTGEFIGSKKRLSNLLQERGFRPKKQMGGTRGYMGIKVTGDPEDGDGLPF